LPPKYASTIHTVQRDFILLGAMVYRMLNKLERQVHKTHRVRLAAMQRA
jgi:hypothetical protein